MKNNVRIIAGSWRGRRLSFPDAQGLRPTPDRVRETLFNWLQFSLRGARCLDAFCGSGALAFEALSRGAAEVVALENNPAVFQSLTTQATTLEAKNLKLFHQDAMAWLQQTPVQAFDLVFLDPPFAAHLLLPCFKIIAERGWLKSEGLIYCEHTAFPQAEELPENWKIFKQEKAGSLKFGLLVTA